MANRNFPSNKLYQFESYPVLLSCNFVVDSTNGNGLGIRSLKGGGIQNVFMHTSSTPGRGNAPLLQPSSPGYLNPNPASGLILVQLQDNYNRSLNGFHSIVSPVTGSNLTAIVAGTAYVITGLGTATAAQWLAAGVPVGITPAVGVSFVSIETATIGGSATVKAVGNSGIDDIEVIGNPNLSLANSAQPQNGGGFILLQCLGQSVTIASYTPAGTNSAPVLTMDSYTPAGTNANDGPPETFTGTPAVLTGSVSAPVFSGTPATLTGTVSKALTAPANESVISLSFYLSNSSLQIAGQ